MKIKKIKTIKKNIQNNKNIIKIIIINKKILLKKIKYKIIIKNFYKIYKII